MPVPKFPGKALIIIGLVLVSLLILVLIYTCTSQPDVDVEATAQYLARLWGTQTAEAQSATPTARATSDTPTPVVTQPVATERPTPTATDTPRATPTSTVTPTQVPSVTVTQVPSATATASPRPIRTPTATPPCAALVNPELAARWDRAKLGCPTAKSSVIWAAWEPFQRGDMFWRSDIDWIYALHWEKGTDASRGDWSTGKDAWKWDASFPDGRGLTPPPGFFEPIRGFGYVWYNFLAGPDSAVGWATAQEKGFCATLQPFENGLIFHSSTVYSCQDGMYNWATEPSFKPLFFTIYADGTWQRH